MLESRYLLVGTRKGLLTYEQQNGGWSFVREDFRGAPVSFATVDARNGTWWACVDYGHWCNNLHRSLDDGNSWQEIPAPRYPEDSLRPDGQPAATSYLWIVQPGSQLPDSSTVAAIERRSGKWVLVTSAERIVEIAQ